MYPPLVFFGQRAEKMLRQQRNVFAPFPQRRQHEIDHVQPIVQVFTKDACGNGFFKVAMRRRQDADIDRACFGRPDRPDFAFLQYPEQLDLQGRGHVADLVQEYGSALRAHKQAGMVSSCSRKGALDVPEQFRFQQFGGNGAAVDRDKGLRVARAGAVNRAGQQLFTGAGFALDQ